MRLSGLPGCLSGAHAWTSVREVVVRAWAASRPLGLTHWYCLPDPWAVNLSSCLQAHVGTKKATSAALAGLCLLPLCPCLF